TTGDSKSEFANGLGAIVSVAGPIASQVPALRAPLASWAIDPVASTARTPPAAWITPVLLSAPPIRRAAVLLVVALSMVPRLVSGAALPTARFPLVSTKVVEELARDELAATAKVPPATLSVSPVTVRLLTDALPVRVTVIFPGWLMTTSLLALGTAPVLQLLAVFHDPLAVLIQVSVLGTTRSSSSSSRGRAVCRLAF